ncbi:EamA family transporter RarD [Arthrobacter sp. zg-Y1219]|uniref:EamA family transporter RarD n=1 Tax=Arthrobacter sp. zg-Y1219 TaxID=3049067 RepID=UPI0024C2C129|nr:EamA family transporter RarD [Arthrobacter sp. zg-Y1219]MDK1359846.1 EamA family transporter RarD [Arthrobacter sp. zg-Y1219]
MSASDGIGASRSATSPESIRSPARAAAGGSAGTSGTTPAGGKAAPGTRGENTPGLLFGVGAYLLWGLLPLYFMVLVPAGAIEIVAARIVFSLVFCVALLTVMRSWRTLAAAARNLRLVGTLGGAAVLIAVNWTTYAWAVLNEHAVEAALGYFINPLVSVLLGVIVLKEKLRPLQWVAMGVGFVAVLVLGLAYGTVPWIALILAFSFGTYGLVKKGVGGRVDAISSLTIETAVLTPVAIAVLVWMSVNGTATILSNGPAHFWLLAASGVLTAVPLIFFGAAARRLPLSTVGMLQYLAPTLQFIIALAVFKEVMPPERWAGFGLVWLALVILTVDMMGGPRRNRILRAAAA